MTRKKTKKIPVVFTARADDEADLPELLRHVAGMIEEGYTSGYQPTWDVSEEE